VVRTVSQTSPSVTGSYCLAFDSVTLGPLQ
jgi:hypothetical protein